MLESKIKKVLRSLITEEDVTETQVIFTPDEYAELLPYFGWSGVAVANMKQYRGKEIVINGKLDLSRKPVKDLGEITVMGTVDLSNTQIKSIDGITSKGAYISTWGTPYQKQKDYQEYLKQLRKQENMREMGAWDDDGTLDDKGKCANALFKYLISTSHEPKEEGDKERLEQLEAEKERREQIEVETEDDENLAELERINDEINEIEQRIDVYDLIPDGRRYRLYGFKVAGADKASKTTYYIGDEYDTETTAIETTLETFDSAGGVENAVSEWVINDNIDKEELRNYFRDGEYDNVRDNLEDYFDEDDFEYNDPKVQERIDEITELLEDSESLSQEEYDELNEELDDLKDSDKDVPEYLIDKKVESLLDDLVDDPRELIRNYGLDISNFVDIDEIAKDVVRSDGYGSVINYYDGTEDSVEYDGKTYYIFEIEE
jgi:hypothetical protein